jgi:hypothetical protein
MLDWALMHSGVVSCWSGVTPISQCTSVEGKDTTEQRNSLSDEWVSPRTVSQDGVSWSE